MNHDGHLSSILDSARASAPASVPAEPPPAPAAPATETAAEETSTPPPAPPTEAAIQSPTPDPEPAPSPGETPEPTPDDEDLRAALQEAGIDPADPKALPKLAAAYRARTSPPAAPAPEPAPAVEYEPLESVARSYALQDEVCQSHATSFSQFDKAANEIAQRDATTQQVVGGKLLSVQADIQALRTMLHPVKVGDIEPPELDEFQSRTAQDKLRDLRDEARELIDQEKALRDRAVAHAQAYYKRVDGHVGQEQARREQVAADEEYERQVVAGAEVFKADIRAAFDAEYKASGLPADEAEEIFDLVTLKLQRVLHRLPEGKMLTSDGNPQTDARLNIKRLVHERAQSLDKHHRIVSGIYATKLRGALPSAPPAALAPHTPPGQTQQRVEAETPNEGLSRLMSTARAEAHARR